MKGLTREFELNIIQHPKRTRMTGFTALPERRFLYFRVANLTFSDPILVLEVKVKDEKEIIKSRNLDSSAVDCSIDVSKRALDDVPDSQEKISTTYDSLQARLLCHVSLTTENGAELACIKRIETDSSEQHTTLFYGETTGKGKLLTDMNGVKTLYFIFADLSVRIAGRYRLRCRMLDMMTIMTPNSEIVEVISDVFEVFSPNMFPGMQGLSHDFG